MTSESHAVVSLTPNPDGSVGVQRLAVGSEEACLDYARTAKPVTSDPGEVIGVLLNSLLAAEDSERLRGLN